MPGCPFSEQSAGQVRWIGPERTSIWFVSRITRWGMDRVTNVLGCWWPDVIHNTIEQKHVLMKTKLKVIHSVATSDGRCRSKSWDLPVTTIWNRLWEDLNIHHPSYERVWFPWVSHTIGFSQTKWFCPILLGAKMRITQRCFCLSDLRWNRKEWRVQNNSWYLQLTKTFFFYAFCGTPILL